MMDEIPNIEVGKINIDPKSTLIMYTDGVVEQENAKGKQFGLKRLIREVKAFSTLSMADMNYTIFSKLDEWKEDLNYTDDTRNSSGKIWKTIIISTSTSFQNLCEK